MQSTIYKTDSAGYGSRPPAELNDHNFIGHSPALQDGSIHSSDEDDMYVKLFTNFSSMIEIPYEENVKRSQKIEVYIFGVLDNIVRKYKNKL